PRTRSRQPDVRRVDPELRHQMQDLQLLLDRRILHRRGLQPVPQRLVIQLDSRCGIITQFHRIPVIDKFRFLHLSSPRPYICPLTARWSPGVAIVNGRTVRDLGRAPATPAPGSPAGAGLNRDGTMTAIDRLLADPAVSGARRILHDTDARTLADQLELVQIPAPAFGEAERGRRMAELFREAGLTAVSVDEVGNVLARLEPAAEPDAPPCLISAHLDTIFPEGTDVTVKRDGARYC